MTDAELIADLLLREELAAIRIAAQEARIERLRAALLRITGSVETEDDDQRSDVEIARDALDPAP